MAYHICYLVGTHEVRRQKFWAIYWLQFHCHLSTGSWTGHSTSPNLGVLHAKGNSQKAHLVKMQKASIYKGSFTMMNVYTTNLLLYCFFSIKETGLPWWRSGWESACQCRGHGFKPWSGRIPHAAEQLGPWATTAEPARLEPVLRNGRGRDSERPAHRNEEWPPLAAARESPRTEMKTQHR